MAFLAIVVGLAIGGLIAFPFIKKSIQTVSSSKKELNSGTIIQRGTNFHENVQTYTLKRCLFKSLVETIKQQDLDIDIDIDINFEDNIIYFKDVDWTASLKEIKNHDDSASKYVFKFHNKHTSTYNINRIDINIRMNKLTTAVDRAFLLIDSYTKVCVSKHFMETKTHSDFF